MSVMEQAPEDLAARAFMRHKGYDAQPLGVEKAEGSTWFFYFEVPEGLIELEVEYGPQGELPVESWSCRVNEFWLYDEMDEGWRPAEFVQQLLLDAEEPGG